jgi:hypothetical protein
VCIGCYDIMTSWIYCKNEEDWQPALLTTNFLSKCGKGQSNFRHIFKVLSHDIARYLIVSVRTQWRLEALFQRNLEYVRYTAYVQIRMRRDSFITLGQVIWQLSKEISEFEASFCNMKPSLQKYIFLRLISFTLLQDLTTNWSWSGK